MINKDKLKNGVLVASIIMIGVNCVNLYEANHKIASLENEMRGVHFQLSQMESRMSGSYSNIEEMLTKQQSMFAKTSVNMKCSGNKLEVIMQAEPKQINDDEKLIAKVIANGKEYEQAADENNQAVITVEITDRITPVFIIKSDMGIKQEVLEEMYVSDIFTNTAQSEWLDNELDMNKIALHAWINGDFKKEDIAKAEFVVVDTGITLAANEGYSSSSASSGSLELPSKDIEGTIITAEEITTEDRASLAYSGDFSAYLETGKRNLYNVYFSLTMQDGMKYITPYNPIATFSFGEGGRNISSGNVEMLMPIVK